MGIHKIGHIFISHLHGDHYLGLAGLLFSMHLQRRITVLHLYSHRGLDEILLTQLKHSRSVLNFKIIFHFLNEEKSEVILDNDVLTVETIPLDHKIKTSGFLIREKPKSLHINKARLPENILLQHIADLKRGLDVYDEQGHVLYRYKEYTLPANPSYSYAYCSDTQPSPSIISQIKGVDLLYHEATFREEEKEKARDTKHSTASEAARVAADAGVKRLIIGHFSARYRDLQPLLDDAQIIFPNTELAIEGTTFELGKS